LRMRIATATLAVGLALATPRHSIAATAGEVSLRDMKGEVVSRQLSSGKVTVVMFFSTRCPMSNAFNFRRNQLFHDFADRAEFLAIDPNVNESLDELRQYSKDAGFDVPVYQDPDSRAADLLDARNTTETFVLDDHGTVRYRGYIEDAPNPERTTKRPLRAALEQLLAGRTVAVPETRGIGCAIRRPRK
jgi:peroxiredoxin